MPSSTVAITWLDNDGFGSNCFQELDYNVAVEEISATEVRLLVFFYSFDPLFPNIFPFNLGEGSGGSDTIPDPATIFYVSWEIEETLGETTHSSGVAELEWDDTPNDPSTRESSDGAIGVYCWQSGVIARPENTETEIYSVNVGRAVIFHCPCGAALTVD